MCVCVPSAMLEGPLVMLSDSVCMDVWMDDECRLLINKKGKPSYQVKILYSFGKGVRCDVIKIFHLHAMQCKCVNLIKSEIVLLYHIQVMKNV